MLSLALFLSTEEATNDATLKLLREAALSRYEPAQALLASYYCRTEEALPPESETTYFWLLGPVQTGAVICAEQLKCGYFDVYKRARSVFHLNGGYNQYYNLACKGEPNTDSTSTSANPGYCRLHWLAAYGTHEALEAYFKLQGSPAIDEMTTTNGTALYFACMRGDLSIAKALLREGADPSIFCGPHKSTCLHWLCAFDEHDQEEAARELIAHGSNINALTSSEVPFFHFPFSLPRGAPLHWAITLHSESAVRTLIDLGADVSMRNKSDSHTWDDRIRVFHRDFSSNSHVPTTINEDALGFSPLDIASSSRFAYPFRYLLGRSATKFDINDSDEEDFTLYHHLSSPIEGRTRLGVTYNTQAFQGNQKQQAETLSDTVHAITAFGADVNLFTRQSIPPIHELDSSEHSGLTPLMLAAENRDLQLAAELIDAGADIHRRNGQGMTAVFCLFFSPRRAPWQQNKGVLEVLKLFHAHGADLKARTPRGWNSILTLAAAARMLDVVEFMLDVGADMTDRDHNPRAHFTDCNVWAMLFTGRGSDQEAFDRGVCRLLQNYLCVERDPNRKKCAMEDVDDFGSNLLHYYVSHPMPQSVWALLHAGCTVNKVSTKCFNAGIFKGKINGSRRIWEATPLDVAFREKSSSEKEEEPFSRAEKTRALERVNQIIAALREFGGKSVLELQQQAIARPCLIPDRALHLGAVQEMP